MSIQKDNLLIAVDCIKGDQNLKTALKSANNFSKKIGWKTESVSVISPEELDWPKDFINSWHNEFLKLGTNKLNHFFKRNSTAEKNAYKVLLQPYKSKKETVNVILNEAKKKKSSAIAVFTHAYRKNKLHFFGSLVTSLIHKSRVPILVFNASAPSIHSLKTILFATDFSIEEERSFQKCLHLASKLKAKLILVHAIRNPYISGIENWGMLTTYLAEEESLAKKNAEKWVNKAKKSKVNVLYKVINNSSSVSDSILKSANSLKADLIVVTQRTNPLETLILGSVTRDILTESKKPVLVIPTLALNSKH